MTNIDITTTTDIETLANDIVLSLTSAEIVSLIDQIDEYYCDGELTKAIYKWAKEQKKAGAW